MPLPIDRLPVYTSHMNLSALGAMARLGQGARRRSPYLLQAFALSLSLCFSACFRISGNSVYEGPPVRPVAMEQYYAPEHSYESFREEIKSSTKQYTIKHITIESYAGPIVVDYFQTQERSESLVLVFPVLGGKNVIENHIAKYFAESGFDAAIVHRNNEFKDPQKFDQLEDLLRSGIIRDRLALDFFENEYGKQKFGTFGISRGAINVALTAGVDDRLKYNVLVMGGTDLVDLFRDSNQARIAKYVQEVSKSKGFSEDQFFEALRMQLRTDPKNTARYLDSRDTLLILGIFDRTVPFTYGMKLREQIGRPETIFLCADHYVGVLFTQTISIIPPSKEGSGIFPFPYVEQEALNFYYKHFKDSWNWKVAPFRILQTPLNLVAEGLAEVGSAVEWIFDSEESGEIQQVEQEHYWVAALKGLDTDDSAAEASTALSSAEPQGAAVLSRGVH